MVLLLRLCTWLNDSSLGTTIRESDNLFSIIETVHVLGITLAVGTILVVDLRLLGLALRQIPASQVVRSVVKLTWAGFVLMVVSGGLLFWSEALKLFGSGLFRAKILLLLLAGVNAGVFHLVYRGRQGEWDAPRTPAGARVAAVLSIGIWSAIIALGRGVAYQ